MIIPCTIELPSFVIIPWRSYPPRSNEVKCYYQGLVSRVENSAVGVAVPELGSVLTESTYFAETILKWKTKRTV